MLNWSDIDTVLLDMDGTLLDLSYDNFFWHHHLPEHYAKLHQLELTQAQTFLEETSAKFKGSLNWYCLDHWSELLDIDLEKLKAEISHLVRFRPQTIEFLAFLKEIDKQLILVTNAHPKTLRLKAEASGLYRHINRTVSSHDLALAKENSGFWPKLANTEKIDLSRSLFIDDSLAVLNCARNEGVRYTVQILQPDTGLAPVEQSDFHGIVHFDELMVSQ